MNLIDEILINIFTFLKPNELLMTSITSKRFNKLSNLEIIWKALCDKKWKNKFFLFQNKLIDNNSKKNYFIAIRDKKRKVITEEELTSYLWLFKY
jgi:hypothetical protein